jgi:hypothetical protein
MTKNSAPSSPDIQTIRRTYNFCNPHNDILSQVASILSKHLFYEIEQKLIEERYQEMIDNFYTPFNTWPPKNSYAYASYGDMAIPSNKIHDDLSQAKNIGIDLPTWFNCKSNQQKVMIVGMEPLRQYDMPNYATVSSPFGLHHFNDKKNPSRNLVYKFIRQLITNNFSVYLTDISKIYSLKNGKKYYGSVTISENIFNKELETFKPNYILCLGKSAHLRLENFFKNSDENKPSEIIMLTHPAARKGNKRYYDYFASIVSPGYL